ncbi:MAG: diphosphomevalonate decarboxylase [Gammaproteobacteria bacterium]|nr:diphosphomevalonate decarboxylase [Gammaproteobacteria bacterium]MDH3749966.1 diphosphomevalonate decarboxylase [Gammaproteobacteria bacterium]MDH3803833.1 diphosphomevalonate decarboxylase [Gammaproteobacteria bacterium]
MRVTAKAQPNIALIKYWGKRDTRRNLPAVGSISITLADLSTTMSVEFDASLGDDILIVNDRDNIDMLPRIKRCLDNVLGEGRQSARVDSHCNFPIAAGLASSASAFAALVVAADGAVGPGRDTAELASLAGMASGSAARSLCGGYVELQNCGADISVQSLRSADEWPLKVVVAITATAPKPVGSTDAMEISRKTSPFFGRWIDQQAEDLADARAAIGARDFAKLASVAEHNCLKMHSVMWGSRPPVIYWNSATLACMQTVRELQSQGVAVFFTIDAGPQVKAVCEPAAEPRVREALAATAGVEDILVSGLGAGAGLIADE